MFTLSEKCKLRTKLVKDLRDYLTYSVTFYVLFPDYPKSIKLCGVTVSLEKCRRLPHNLVSVLPVKNAVCIGSINK